MSRKYVIKVNSKSYEVEVEEVGQQAPSASRPGPAPQPVAVSLPPAPAASPAKPQAAPAGGGKVVPAPMTGTVIKVLCQVGQQVKEGDVLLKLEAMKMETSISSPFAGQVAEIPVAERQNVNAGQTLVVLK